MSAWPPETVRTPMGEEPFEQAVRWHMPTMLRWLEHNRDATYMPSGDRVGAMLRMAADRLECFAATKRAPEQASALADELERRRDDHHGHRRNDGRWYFPIRDDEATAAIAALRTAPPASEEAVEALLAVTKELLAPLEMAATELQARGAELDATAQAVFARARAAIASLSASPVTPPGAEREAVLEEATAESIAREIDHQAFRDGDIGGLRANQRQRLLLIAERLKARFSIRALKTTPSPTTADQGGEAGK